MYEQCPQVLTAAFADPHHHPTITTRMLARHEPEPSRQMSAILEVGAIADCGDHRGSRFWSDASDPGDPLADRAGLEDYGNLLIEGPDPIVDLKHEVVQA